MHPGGWGCYENTFKLFSGIPAISHFVLYLRNYKECEAEISDLEIEKYELSFDIRNIYYPQVSPRGWECDRHILL